MALVYSDRTKETSKNSGTGSYTLRGAELGHQSFSAGVGVGNTCYYSATDGTDWEVGLGTLSDATTLARTTILASSNSNSAVDWDSGTKEIYVTLPASHINDVSEDTSPTLGGNLAGAGFTITNIGSLVVGTTSLYSTADAEVYGNGADTEFLVHEDAGTHEARLHLRSGTRDWEIINDTANLTFEVEDSEVFNINSSGNASVTGTLSATGGVLITSPSVPASASATGTTGTIAWDANYIYVCTATDTWKRVAIATW